MVDLDRKKPPERSLWLHSNLCVGDEDHEDCKCKPGMDPDCEPLAKRYCEQVLRAWEAKTMQKETDPITGKVTYYKDPKRTILFNDDVQYVRCVEYDKRNEVLVSVNTRDFDYNTRCKSFKKRQRGHRCFLSDQCDGSLVCARGFRGRNFAEYDKDPRGMNVCCTGRDNDDNCIDQRVGDRCWKNSQCTSGYCDEPGFYGKVLTCVNKQSTGGKCRVDEACASGSCAYEAYFETETSTYKSMDSKTCCDGHGAVTFNGISTCIHSIPTFKAGAGEPCYSPKHGKTGSTSQDRHQCDGGNLACGFYRYETNSNKMQLWEPATLYHQNKVQFTGENWMYGSSFPASMISYSLWKSHDYGAQVLTVCCHQNDMDGTKGCTEGLVNTPCTRHDNCKSYLYCNSDKPFDLGTTINGTYSLDNSQQAIFSRSFGYLYTCANKRAEGESCEEDRWCGSGKCAYDFQNPSNLICCNMNGKQAVSGVWYCVFSIPVYSGKPGTPCYAPKHGDQYSESFDRRQCRSNDDLSMVACGFFRDDDSNTRLDTHVMNNAPGVPEQSLVVQQYFFGIEAFYKINSGHPVSNIPNYQSLDSVCCYKNNMDGTKGCTEGEIGHPCTRDDNCKDNLFCYTTANHKHTLADGKGYVESISKEITIFNKGSNTIYKCSDLLEDDTPCTHAHWCKSGVCIDNTCGGTCPFHACSQYDDTCPSNGCSHCADMMMMCTCDQPSSVPYCGGSSRFGRRLQSGTPRMLTLSNMSYLVDYALAEQDDDKRLQLAYEMLELRGPISMYASVSPDELELFRSTIQPKYIQLWNSLENLTHIRRDRDSMRSVEDGDDEEGSGSGEEEGSGNEDEEGSGSGEDQGSGP